MSDPEKPARVFLDMALIARLQVASVEELLVLVEAELRVFHELAEHSAEAKAIYQYQLRHVPSPPSSSQVYYQADIVKSSVLAQRSELALDLQQRRIDVIGTALHAQLTVLFEGNASIRGMVRRLRSTVREEMGEDLAEKGEPPLTRWGNEPTP